MSRRGDTRPDFEEFVVVCADGLLRTAYLLTRDPSLAEDLLQTALTKAWFAWTRLDEQPEPYARTTLATTYATWWRRRWRGVKTAPLASASACSCVNERRFSTMSTNQA